MKKHGSIILILIFAMFILDGCAKKDIKKDKDIEESDLNAENPRYGKAEVGFSGEMKMVHFDYDKYMLSPAAREILKNNAEWIKQHPKVSVQVEGHCDARGTEEYNIALGQKRAESVRKYLVDLGVVPGKLTTVSYGEDKPIVKSEAEEAWAKNRRAEFVITTK